MKRSKAVAAVILTISAMAMAACGQNSTTGTTTADSTAAGTESTQASAEVSTEAPATTEAAEEVSTADTAAEETTETAEAQDTEAAPLTSWAYAFALNNADAGVGTLYYAQSYFDEEGITNPATASAYTEDEIAAIKDGAVVGAEGYITAVPTNAVLGATAVDSDDVFWYDADNSAKITASADPLLLDAGTGTFTNTDGEEVATALPKAENWAVGAYTLNSADLGIGTIYYAESYFDKDGIVNPITVAPYTEAEIAEVKSAAVEGNENIVTDVPEGAVMGISANGTDTIYWYDDDNAAAIVSHSDALILNAETGALTTAADGTEAATPLS